MILDPKVVRQVERGEKTQHRVLIATARTVTRAAPTALKHRDEPKLERVGLSATYETKPFRPEVGQSIIIQTRTENEDEAKRLPEVRVRVTGRDRATLADITPAGAKAEGWPTLAEFADQWMRGRDKTWPPKEPAICKECQGDAEYKDHDGLTVPCEHCDDGEVQVDAKPGTGETLAHFNRVHGHHLVWVVSFELDTDVLRYLNRRPHMPPTTSVSEALDQTAPLLGEPRLDWKQRADIRRREALRDRDGARLAGLSTAEDRLAELQLLAVKRGVDIDVDLRYIRHRLDRIEDKVRRAPDRRAA